jgi:hypothetical protein
VKEEQTVQTEKTDQNKGEEAEKGVGSTFI